MQSLSKDELERLLSVARAHSRRDWLMLLVSYWHGLRVSEVLGLTPAYIVNGYLDVQRLKGSERTVQPLIAHENDLLNERTAVLDFIQGMQVNQKLFPVHRTTAWRAIQRYGKLAGVPEHKLHPHVLKHSIAMHTIQLAGVHNVRKYLGHKSGSSTLEYLKVSDEAAAAAVGRAALD